MLKYPAAPTLTPTPSTAHLFFFAGDPYLECPRDRAEGDVSTTVRNEVLPKLAQE
jgi:hypothetical protein